MKVTFEGDTLHIEAEMNLSKTSRSGNSTIVATTRGQQYIGEFQGRPTYLQLNVMQMETGAVGQGIEVVNAPSTTSKKSPQRAA